MRHFLLFILVYLMMCASYAQNKAVVEGRVMDINNLEIGEATIIVFNTSPGDSIKLLSNLSGFFRFNANYSTEIRLIISHIGYKTEEKVLKTVPTKDTFSLGIIRLVKDSSLLSNIVIESQKIQIKEDTVSYIIDSTMYRKNDNVEALLKNLPGVQVDKDGTVTAQGKQVTKVKVNGKEFFNGDVTTATRELNADMIERIQIIDDYGDQSAFTGIKEGDPTKTMNIQLRKDKNKGYFGNASVGMGTENRYLSAVSLNRFNNEQQISILSNVNNTNVNLFNFGSMGGGMARSMGSGRGGGQSSGMGINSSSDGINLSKSIGINYRDEWGSKISIYGSLSVSKKSTNTLKNSTQQNIFENRTSSYILNANNNTVIDNQRFSLNLEYKIDSMNYIKFNPSMSANQNTGTYFSDFTSFVDLYNISLGTMNDQTQSENPAFSGTLLYNHRFKKRGRYTSWQINGGNSNNLTTEDYQNNTSYFPPNGNRFDSLLFQKITQDNDNVNYGTKLSYTEPVTKKRSLEVNYAYNVQRIGNDRKNYLLDTVLKSERYVPGLSNIFDNEYVTNKIGFNIRTTLKKYNYTLGFSAQPAIIQTNSISNRLLYSNRLINYYPVFRFAYNFSRSRSFNINYNGSTNQPTNAQLLPVTDNSNPQFISIGNPDLRPEFSNNLAIRYNNFDYITGNVFFGNINASYIQDKIVNNIKLLRNGVQEATYQNAQGYYSFSGLYNISRPILNRKFVFNISGNIAYANNISFISDSINNVNKNIGANWILSQRFGTDVKIKKWLETNLTLNYGVNDIKNSYQSNVNSNTTSWVISSNSRFFLPFDFIVSYDVEKTINTGYADNVNSNLLIINTTLEKQFLVKKNLSLKCQGFDLLNQNISVNRTVNGTGFTDTRTNKLGRYYLLSVVYKLNKFSGKTSSFHGDLPMGQDRGEYRSMRNMGL